MDKQLIEQCAIAAMKEVATSGQMGDASDDELSAIANMNEKDKALTVALFSEFLARIDAERGKGAKLPAAFISFDDFLNEPQRSDEPMEVREYRHQAYREWLKVIAAHKAALSPTIPEGMAPVNQKVNYFDAQKIADEYGLDYNKFCAAHSAMIAAAQGERNELD